MSPFESAPDQQTASAQPLRPLTTLQRAAICFGVVAMGAGMTINFVVVAPLARETGLSEIGVAGILTVSTLLYALFTPSWGRLADRFGRKRVMAFSLFAMAGTNAAFALALDAALAGLVTGLSVFFLLAFVRVFFGLLSPGLHPASMAAMIDATTPQTRAAGLGLIGTAMGVGSILGPAGAAVLAPLGALAPLWGSILFSFLAGIVILISLPTTRSNGIRSTRPPPLKLSDKRMRPHLMFLFSYFCAVGAIQLTLPFLVQDRFDLEQASAVQMTGIAFAGLSIAMIIVQFGYVQPFKPSPRRMLPIGLLLVLVGYVGAVLLTPFWLLCASFAFVGAGGALAIPAANALGSLAVEPAEQGGAAALLASAPPWAFVIGPFVGAVLYRNDPVLPLSFSAIIMGALFVYAQRTLLSHQARSTG